MLQVLSRLVSSPWVAVGAGGGVGEEMNDLQLEEREEVSRDRRRSAGI